MKTQIAIKQTFESRRYRRDAAVYFYTGIWPTRPKYRLHVAASGLTPITLTSEFNRKHFPGAAK